jgi:transposase-like protein
MPQGRHTSYVVTLTLPERRHLEALQRQPMVRMGLMRRARILLLLAEGCTITDVAQRVGLSRRHIYKWLWRYAAEGLAGLNDRPGRGAKPRGAHA